MGVFSFLQQKNPLLVTSSSFSLSWNSNLPFYRKPLETKPSETYESAVNGVREVRLLAQSGWGQLEAFKQKVDNVINTGIAHTAGKSFSLQDNILHTYYWIQWSTSSQSMLICKQYRSGAGVRRKCPSLHRESVRIWLRRAFCLNPHPNITLNEIWTQLTYQLVTAK